MSAFFKLIMLSEILSELERKNISKQKLSEMTGIKRRTLFYILSSEENLQNTSFKNVTLIKQAIDLPVIIAGDKVYHFSSDNFDAAIRILSGISS